MLRLRCPHHGCSIDVADDKIGEWMRCPQCQQLLIVDPKHIEHPTAQPEAPDLALHAGSKRPPDKPDQGENRLYAGLPPLAVMLGIRQGRGANWKDVPAVHAQMTVADWAALAAFEKVIGAVRSLKMAVMNGVGVMAITAMLWWAAAQISADESAFIAKHWSVWILTLALLTAGFVLMSVAARRLPELKIGAIVEMATWSAAGVAFIFVVQAARNLLALWGNASDRTPFAFALLAIPIQLIAVYSAVSAGLWVRHAQKQVRPAAVWQLLTEALRLLRARQD